MVKGSGFRVQNFGVYSQRVKGLESLGLRFRVWSLKLRVRGLEVGVEGLG